MYPLPGWNRADAFEHAYELRLPSGKWVFLVTDSLFNLPPFKVTRRGTSRESFGLCSLLVLVTL